VFFEKNGLGPLGVNINRPLVQQYTQTFQIIGERKENIKNIYNTYEPQIQPSPVFLLVIITAALNLLIY
jgi:hypothetical protein